MLTGLLMIMENGIDIDDEYSVVSSQIVSVKSREDGPDIFVDKQKEMNKSNVGSTLFW